MMRKGLWGRDEITAVEICCSLHNCCMKWTVWTWQTAPPGLVWVDGWVVGIRHLVYSLSKYEVKEESIIAWVTKILVAKQRCIVLRGRVECVKHSMISTTALIYLIDIYHHLSRIFELELDNCKLSLTLGFMFPLQPSVLGRDNTDTSTGINDQVKLKRLTINTKFFPVHFCTVRWVGQPALDSDCRGMWPVPV